MTDYQEKYFKHVKEHRENVSKAYDWLLYNIPRWLIDNNCTGIDIAAHDRSKFSEEEFDQYAYYFNVSKDNPDAVANFKNAWLHHIHVNPHHWQHWVLINDEDGVETLPMPKRYIIEAICDWWAFSWKSGNLFEIFDWYEAHKDGIMLNSESRKFLEDTLGIIKTKLENMQSLGIELDNLSKD